MAARGYLRGSRAGVAKLFPHYETSAQGGERAYTGRLGKARNRLGSRHWIYEPEMSFAARISFVDRLNPPRPTALSTVPTSGEILSDLQEIEEVRHPIVAPIVERQRRSGIETFIGVIGDAGAGGLRD